jgi:NDP-sugar pyrophosphorylase family protein
VETIAAREGRALDRGDGCHIADDAVVERSVLWDRVTVGRGARLSHCIVADDVSVPDGAHYENRVLIARKYRRMSHQPEGGSHFRASVSSVSSVDRSDSVYSVDL